MRAIFSVGLNVGNAEPVSQLSDTFDALSARAIVRSFAMGTSEWQGVSERFIQFECVPNWERPAFNLARRMAQVLNQDAVGMLNTAGDAWILVAPNGSTSDGGSVADFPVIVGEQAAHANAQARAAAGADTVGHSSVQPWSAGAIFPATITQRESYPAGYTAADSEPSVAHVLTIGAFSETYATYGDAFKVASWACAAGRIIPERYAQLTAGVNMAPFGDASTREESLPSARSMAPDVRPEDIIGTDIH